MIRIGPRLPLRLGVRVHWHSVFESALVDSSGLYKLTRKIHVIHSLMSQSPNAFEVRYQCGNQHGVQHFAALPCNLRIKFKLAATVLAYYFQACSLGRFRIQVQRLGWWKLP